MNHTLGWRCVCLAAIFLALVPSAMASSTWYVNGVNGNDNNDCKSSSTACKTIGRAISLAAAGDSVSVAAATYTENLVIGISLTIVGSGANTTFINGGGVGREVSVSSSARVTLSKLTMTGGPPHPLGGRRDLQRRNTHNPKQCHYRKFGGFVIWRWNL